MTSKTKAGWKMERRNDWGYPVSAPRIPEEWVRAVCLRLLLVTLMALGLAMIPAADKSPQPQQGMAVPTAETADPYAEMSDTERMAGVVLEPEGE